MNKIFIFTFAIAAVIFSGCSSKSRHYYSTKPMSKPRTYSSSKNNYNSSMSQNDYKYAKMKSYVVHGKRYYPQKVSQGDTFEGTASWYGPDFHAKLTANGETYNMHDMTAAHKTLPMNTVVKVTNNRNGLTAVVRINDRGPFVGRRIIDLSNAAARKINMVGAGTAPVTLEVLGFYSKNIRKTPVSTQAKKIKKTTPIVKKISNIPSRYSLQIASFTNIEGALKTQEDHNGIDGYKTIIKDIQTDEGRFFKVYLQGFQSQKEARDYKANGNFANSFIVKEDKYDY